MRRRSSILSVLILVSLAAFTAGCGSSPEVPKLTPTFSAEIPELKPAPSLTGSIVYQSQVEGKYQIFVVSLAFGESQQLTKEGENIEPSWSPDGKQIAFGCDKGQKFEICVMDADGTNEQQLTQNSYTDWSPSWSTDGKSLSNIALSKATAAFVSCVSPGIP